MMQVDLAQVSVREANELIRARGEAGEDVEVLNPDADHGEGARLGRLFLRRAHRRRPF